MKAPRNKAFTLIELLVVIAIIAILASLAIPAVTGAMTKGQLTQTMSNARQLYIAGFSMATDFNTTGDEHLGWPGDLMKREVEPINGVTDYINRLVEYDYLKQVDMMKVLQAPGVTPWNGTTEFNAQRNCPFKIYRVTDTDGAANIMIATRNFLYNDKLDPEQAPYGEKGFVVFRKGGDGAQFNQKKLVKSLNALGLLPGRTDYKSRTTESADDFLAMN
jgi:prepilin-type N-terminal cleavage/methylation domain-containing protein